MEVVLMMVMENEKLLYTAPRTTVVEVKTEGNILIGSPGFGGGGSGPGNGGTI